ncbi:prefoldin subunit alpha [Desulfurococcaceae archaeon MEX13E-LK6-19]|nr:prefoldin subunit alpha [Desulfurococcaceae archaeon MEX13E-LK6-19]
MSKKTSEEKREIDVNALLARINELRGYIEILQNQVNTLAQELSELQLALASIKGLSEVTDEREALIAVDRLATVFVPAKISGSWSKNLLVNIGRNYYVKTDSATAEKIISKRIGALQNLIRMRQQELSRALNEYNYLQQIIAAAFYQAQAVSEQQKS